MSRAIPILLTVTMAVTGQAMAQSGLPANQSDALLRKVALNSLPLMTSTNHIYSINPATMTYQDSISLSSISLTEEYSHLQKAVMEQLGTGYNSISVTANSYLHLSPCTTVWGKAGFTTSKKHNVKWTNCIDYLRVAPYVLGDEVGGNLSLKRYTFTGGYSGLFGKWTAGISADYRAEIAYRDRDPRVKTVVSDLNVKLGSSYLITTEYSLGLNGGLNIYNQNCDLEFYNPMNDINTFTLTGLGTYYNRFMGNTNKSSGYQSVGFNASLQFVSTVRQGFMSSFEFDHYKMEQHLRNFNNLTLGFSDVNTITANLAYKFHFSQYVKFQPIAEAHIVSHKGTENLFGTSAGASYDKIGSRSIYRHNTSLMRLSFPLQIQHEEIFYTLTPYTGYDFDREHYLDPNRELQASHIIPGLTASISTTSRKWLWNAMIDGSYAKASSNTPMLTGLDTGTPLAQCVLSNFDMLKAELGTIQTKISGGYVINGILLDLTVNYEYSRFYKEGDCHSVSISLCAKF